MTKGICMIHGKEVCKICHACDDCGINACIHTKHGLIIRSVFEGIKIGCNNNFSDSMIIEAKKIILDIEKENGI